MSDTLFTQVNYTVGSLLDAIELGDIALPDLQRPFVWKNSKVRNLFDSMYHGYPVGYLLFWHNAVGSAKQIGTNQKQTVPRLLVVDGQQRLTSMYAVIKRTPVVREDYSEELIEIAFNPLMEKFEVADAAVRRDTSFIPDISRLWAKDSDLFEVVESYLEELSDARDLTEDERKKIKRSITRLNGLLTFPFTALQLTAGLEENQVAEIFVRINSEGKTLNQADFILTLMSVFWDDGRKRLEAFSRAARKPSTSGPTSFNHFIVPDPDQLLRVSVGVAFRRARLRAVYAILRGRDVDSGEFDEERRDSQFDKLQDAQERVLNLTYWHDFMNVLLRAGFRGNRMISSETSVLYTYVMYLIGRTDYGVGEKELRRVLARWFFMSTLTGRYSASPESAMEFDLARFREVTEPAKFVAILDRIVDESLTEDFWNITLPNYLATSAARGGALFGYYASLNILDAQILFSDRKVAELLDPAVTAKKPVERHHLFPKAYLKEQGITSRRQQNQIANQALVEWRDNLNIGKQAPSTYMDRVRESIPAEELERMYYWHALPDGWEDMAYEEFLEQRRSRIAQVMRDAYEKLSTNSLSESFTVGDIYELVRGGEGTEVEFKSTLRVNLHTKEKDWKMELSCLKTIAGFLNSEKGGTLLVGVADDGAPLGVKADRFSDEDKMHLHLINLIKGKIGAAYMMYIHPRFEEYRGKRVMAVGVKPARSPAFVSDGSDQRFYVRAGASTAELKGPDAHQYISERF